jgi:hypothetical protein
MVLELYTRRQGPPEIFKVSRPIEPICRTCTFYAVSRPPSIAKNKDFDYRT